MAKYAVVVVTYNRIELLKECIHAINSQKIKAEYIVIVDNASTDGTKDYLQTLQYNPQYKIVYSKENIGGAGGFALGLKYVRKLNVDWVVIIDDDAILDDMFLEQVDSASKKYFDVKAFAGVVYQNGKIDFEHRKTVKMPGYRYESIVVEDCEMGEFRCDSASFCGLVINKEILVKIGLPIKDYFIWYDDTEYCIRIRKLTEIIVVPTAKLNHKVQKNEVEGHRHYTWKDYYGIRNRLWMVKEHGTLIDVLIMKVSVFVHCIIRNWLFLHLHVDKSDWDFEYNLSKKAWKDGVKGRTIK